MLVKQISACIKLVQCFKYSPELDINLNLKVLVNRMVQLTTSLIALYVSSLCLTV